MSDAALRPRLCIQRRGRHRATDPRFYRDPQAIVRQASASIASPQHPRKIPATSAGLRDEAANAEGISINATVCLQSQCVAVAEAISVARARLGRHSTMGPVCTIMVAADDWLKV
jgi:transaldolase